MNLSLLMLLTLVGYFCVLLWMSRRTRGHSDNDAFFRAGRQSPWWMVGFGMIGASISGVSFISVPGWAATTGMTYLQMCAGFFFGYLVVAFVLLPVYYRLRLTSIYAYLGQRFGGEARRTGALFFLLSKLTGAAARLYLVCVVLCGFLFPGLDGGPGGTALFMGVCTLVLVLIWLYTRRSGLFAIVRTDALQTFCLLLALAMMLVAAGQSLHMGPAEMVHTVAQSDMARVIDGDWHSRQYFWRQFLSGVFVVIVMTGLDQDMMQKNLTCRSLREAQKNMCTYGACFLPVNLLLLALGILLYALCARDGIDGLRGDALLPTLVSQGTLGAWVVVPFTVGIVAAAFSSADSALASLTTICCIDLLRLEERGISAERATRVRRRVHLAICAAFLTSIFAYRLVADTNVINAIYVMASYTYGPLLGLYAFGLACRRRVNGRLVWPVCVAAPLVCAWADWAAPRYWGYTFGYELLMVNGLLTVIGLLLISRRAPRD